MFGAEEAKVDLSKINTALDRFGLHVGDATPHSVKRIKGSNEVYEVSFGDGRILMMKFALHPDLVRGFVPERTAGALLRERTDVAAPVHLPASRGDGDPPFVAYWRIDGRTLAETWPGTPSWRRGSLLASWGRLMRRIHDVELPSSGPLPQALAPGASPSAFLGSDLAERLLPASARHWPEGRPAIEILLDAADAAAPSLDAGRTVLVHGDLFAANVLCSESPDEPRCTGILDLEDAMSAPAEADLARTEVLHGPLFGQPWPEGEWFDRLVEGYGTRPDPRLLAIFRAYHMVNLAFHASLTGHRAHARTVASAAGREAAAARRMSPSRRPTARRRAPDVQKRRLACVATNG